MAVSRRRLHRLPAFVVALGLLASACDSGGGSSELAAPTTPLSHAATGRGSHSASGLAEAPTAGTVGICHFAQVADVARAFGARPSAVTVSSRPSAIGDTQCTLVLTSSNIGQPGTVGITLRTHATRAQLDRERRAADHAVDVYRVGDSAFYVAQSTTLRFIRRGSLIMIQVDLRSPAQPQRHPRAIKADVIALAKTLSAQL
jgi:hypothetical protein